MLSRVNTLVWNNNMEEEQQQQTKPQQPDNNNNVNNDHLEISTFKSMLEADGEDWYMSAHPDLSFSPTFTEPSASCSPTSASVFSSLDPFGQHHHLATPSYAPLDAPFIDLPGENNGYLESALSGPHHNNQIDGGLASNFSPNCTSLFSVGSGFGGLGFAGDGDNINPLLLNRSKILKPLDNFTAVGSPPTLFQKRAALRKNLGSVGNLGSLKIGNPNLEMNERKRKASGEDIEDVSIDGSNLNYDSDDQFLECVNKAEEGARSGGSSSHVAGGDPGNKGKKKGPPAKNLMAERRRRQKLNDRLLMLRSVVPKISKMDRASILGDAIDYLKELLQKINDLHNELESIPSGSSVGPSSSFYPLTPTTPVLPSHIKEELCPSAFASPLSSPTVQPARVEVRIREGRAVNIHMFCGRKPGLLLSTLKAMDNLGLDVQQAVISCFSGFALDVFRAEQCGEGQELNPDQIKAVLLDSAGFHGMV